MIDSKGGVIVISVLLVCAVVLVVSGNGWWAFAYILLAMTARFREV